MKIPTTPFEGITPSVPYRFLTDLKALDPGLDCHFSRKYHRFVITQKSNLSGNVPVAIINGYDPDEENPEGTYRYPDQRDIINLQQADLHRHGQEVKDRIKAGEEYMLNHQDKSMKDAEDAIKHQTKIDSHQLLKGYADSYNLGKYNSTYRRVETKPKGKVLPSKGYTVIDKRVGIS
jgi:hypothetical protein